ncbi:MAG TPA: hypothetical protein VMF61_10555 [Candidatus Acidoferrales bacterium]|nr:hypothetical protein [Candidatus Acidoferrales bacterium]
MNETGIPRDVDVPEGMRVAAFEDEPDAQATAILLRELGFTARVVEKGGNSYDERMRAFLSGRTVDFEIHAFLLSDADEERFRREVQVHHGSVLRPQARP